MPRWHRPNETVAHHRLNFHFKLDFFRFCLLHVGSAFVFVALTRSMWTTPDCCACHQHTAVVPGRFVMRMYTVVPRRQRPPCIAMFRERTL